MTLASNIATAIRKATDEDGYLFAEVMSVEDIRIIAQTAAGVAEEHIAKTQSPKPPAQE